MKKENLLFTKTVKSMALFLALCFFLSGLSVPVLATDPDDKTATPAAPSGGMSQISEYPFKVVPDPTFQPFHAGSWAFLHVAIENLYPEALHLKEVVLETSTDSGVFPFDVNSTRIPGSYSNSDAYLAAYDGNPLSQGQDNERTADLVFGNLTVRKDVKDGYYDLRVKIRFERYDGNKWGQNTSIGADKEEIKTDDKTVYEQTLSWQVKFVADPANKTDQRILLEAANLATTFGTYAQTMDLQFGIVNRGFDTADIISVTPVISGDVEKWPFEILQSDYTLAVARQLLPSGDGQTPSEASGTLLLCDFGLMTVREKISSGYKQVDFLVKYKYGSQKIEETTLSTYVNIVGNPSVDNENSGGGGGAEWPSSMPRLMCTGFTTEPAEITGGEDFMLHLTLKNTSTVSAIQNIRVVLSAPAAGDEGEPFLPRSGASSLFIPYIDPDTEYALDVEMASSVKVPQKVYPLNIEMEYEDWKATAINAKEAISIALNQPYRVDVGHLEIMPQELSVGQEANITFPIYNKGKTKLYNVSVTVPEGQGISGAEAFVGNVESGATGQVDMIVRADEPFDPTTPRRVLVSYEDENGKVSSKDVEFSMTVTDAQSMDPGMDPMEGGDFGPEGMPPEMMDPSMNQMQTGFLGGLPNWAWAAIAAGALLLLIILITVATRKKRRKRMALDDEAYFRDLMKH